MDDLLDLIDGFYSDIPIYFQQPFRYLQLDYKMPENPTEQCPLSLSDRNVIYHPDILDTLVDLLSDEKSYGSISLLSSLSKYHRGIVQPRLIRLKKRVVLMLDDYRWRDMSNDRNIEQVKKAYLRENGCMLTYIACLLRDHRIVECSAASEMPSTKSNALRPWKIVYHGVPNDGLLQLRETVFPTISEIWFTENMTTFVLHELESSNPRDNDWPISVSRFNDIAEAFRKTIIDNNAANYDPIFKVYREYHDSLEEGAQYEAMIELYSFVSLPQSTKFNTVSVDYYFHSSESILHEFFYDATGKMPPGYRKLSKLAESTATSCLLDFESTFTLRFFIIGHGGVWQDRDDAVPIYTTTCGIDESGAKSKRTAVVLKRDFDEDFSRCDVNIGCARCRRNDQ